MGRENAMGSKLRLKRVGLSRVTAHRKTVASYSGNILSVGLLYLRFLSLIEMEGRGQVGAATVLAVEISFLWISTSEYGFLSSASCDVCLQ